MSRNIKSLTSDITLVTGTDYMLGDFIQLYDNKMVNETPEQEGLIYDWCEKFGVEVNFTGESSTLKPEEIINNYLLKYDEEIN